MKSSRNQSTEKLLRENLRAVKELRLHVTDSQLLILRELSRNLQLSLCRSDLLLMSGKWYVTHSGLLRVAQRRRCRGITTELAESISNPTQGRWVFKATVFKASNGAFVGYGDADPSNVSPLVRGAEMRVAETRAVNRALRKAYGIGICSIEEVGSVDRFTEDEPNEKKVPQPSNGQGSGNANGSVRDRLCVIIRQRNLNPDLVKAYLADFCSVQNLREATREQVEAFVVHLADWAQTDRNGLLCRLNSYMPSKEGAA